jgi:hypothetical protein
MPPALRRQSCRQIFAFAATPAAIITPFSMIISLSRQLATPHAAYASCLRRCWLMPL